MNRLEALELIAGKFTDWQTTFGRPDPKRSPFVTQGKMISTKLHSPTFIGFGLYAAHRVTRNTAYKAAADRYMICYLAQIRDPPVGGQRQDYPSYPYQYGMALAGYAAFRKENPDEDSFDGKAAAIYEWLNLWKWPEGSYYRNGYGSARHGIPDNANSDDNCHMGRGLIGYHEVSGRKDVLYDAEGLARYYLTEAVLGSYDGCWSSKMGTWVIAPTVCDGIEHYRDHRSFDIGWGFSSVGSIEYLTRVHAATRNDAMKQAISEKCARSMRWQFDDCQYEDGACGMRGREDKWVGMTAGAILSFLRTREAGFLSDEITARYRPKALAARDWMLANLSEETVMAGGFFKITGDSEPRPPENQAWQLGWTMEALARLEEI